MSEVHVNSVYVYDNDKPVLEIKITFWTAIKKSPGPDFELVYSDGTVESAFKPQRKAIGGSGKQKDSYPSPSVWVGRIEQQAFQGKLMVRVWKKGPKGGAPDATQTFEAGAGVQPTVSFKPGVRLVPDGGPAFWSHVNDERWPQPSGAQLSDSDTIQPSHLTTLLNYMYGSLVFGPVAVWELAGTHCLTFMDPTTLGPEDLEAFWAQVITERLSGCPYANPGGTMNMGSGSALWTKVVSNEVTPLTCACEHLCTMGLISRGYDDISQHPVGSNGDAAVSGCAPFVNGGTFNSDATYRDVAKARGIGLGAGSLYHFTKGPHVAFILRTPSTDQAQFFDTGAMNTKGTARSINGPGIHDYAAFTGSILGPGGDPSKNTYRGLLIPGAQTMGLLAQAAARTRRSRPLGLVRLVLFDRTLLYAKGKTPAFQDAMLWASPLLPMWPTKDFAFPISHLACSLRNHPHHARIEARWAIDVPRDSLRDLMIDSPAFHAAWGGRSRDDRVPVSEVWATADLRSREDGRAQFVGHYGTSVDNLGNTVEHWYSQTGDAADGSLGADASNLYHAQSTVKRPPIINQLVVAGPPGQTAAGTTEGVLERHERVKKTTFPNKVVLGDDELTLPRYFQGDSTDCQ